MDIETPIFYGSEQNSIPIVCTKSKDNSINKIWGISSKKDVSVFPAFYPLGKKVFDTIENKLIKYKTDSLFDTYTNHVKRTDLIWQKLYQAFKNKEKISFPFELPEKYFPANFQPYQHQILGITKAVLWWRAFYLWGMGTGKTRTLIDGFRILRLLNEAKKMLVVAPPIVLSTWQNEIKRASQGELTSAIWDGKEKNLEKVIAADIILLTYGRVRVEYLEWSKKETSNLFNFNFDLFVADESHSMGSFESLQTQGVLNLITKAKKRYLLSGTAADHPGKLFPQLKALSPVLMPLNWSDYKTRYYVFYNTENLRKGIVTGYQHLDELNSIVDFISTRMHKKDCVDLPPVTFIDIPFEFTDEQIEQYNASILRLKDYEQYLLEFSEKQMGANVPNGAVLVNKLLQITSGFLIEGKDSEICNGCVHVQNCVEQNIKPYTKYCHVIQDDPPTKILRFKSNKQEIFKDLLERILDSDPTNKVIVWASYTEELNDLEKIVKELKEDFIRIDGKTSKKIGELQEKFKEPSCRIAIGQVSSGIGFSLVEANYMIYYSLTWNLTAYKQSLERNNRPGQIRNMFVYRLISTYENAIDSFLAKTLHFKDRISHTMLEQIVCLNCSMQKTCAMKEIQPFREGCLFKTKTNKPIAKAEYLMSRSK